MKKTALTCVLLLSAMFGTSAEKKNSFYEYISSSLPQGWTCYKHSSDGKIEIVRKEVVVFFHLQFMDIVNYLGGITEEELKQLKQSADEQGESDKYPVLYTINIEMDELLTKEEFWKREEENNIIIKGLQELGNKMSFSKGGVSIHGLNAAEVRQLIDLCADYKKLPDAYDKEHSYYIRTVRGSFYDEAVKKECEEVLGNILTHLCLYRGEGIFRDLQTESYEEIFKKPQRALLEEVFKIARQAKIDSRYDSLHK